MLKIYSPKWLAGALLALLSLSSAHADNSPVYARGEQYHLVVERGVENARATLDDARFRYFTQLAGKADFYCAIRLADNSGKIEQVFVKVTYWGERITGVITTEPVRVRGYERGLEISFDTSEVMDWAIKFRDGRIEGNFIANALRANGLG